MAEIEDINRNITYVRGPQGQTVVIVPPLLPPIEKTDDRFCRTITGGLLIILGPFGLALLSVYGASLMASHTTDDTVYKQFARPLFLATALLTAMGVLCMAVSLGAFLCLHSPKQDFIRRFMYRGSEDYERPLQVNLPSEEGLLENEYASPYEVLNQVRDTAFPGTSNGNGLGDGDEPIYETIDSIYETPGTSYPSAGSQCHTPKKKKKKKKVDLKINVSTPIGKTSLDNSLTDYHNQPSYYGRNSPSNSQFGQPAYAAGVSTSTNQNQPLELLVHNLPSSPFQVDSINPSPGSSSAGTSLARASPLHHLAFETERADTPSTDVTYVSMV